MPSGNRKVWNLTKSFLFKFDAELVHEMAQDVLAALGTLSPRILEWISGNLLSHGPHPRTLKYFGKELSSPLGLAAGFDKNAHLLPYLPHLGFGYAEIGSVTLRPQPGNPKPRLFRGERRLFNCMGFNNDGAVIIARRLENYKLPKDFAVGINLGLNKETSHADAEAEYEDSFRTLYPYGDYFVINVSSPNTPGLRDLQDANFIQKLFSRLKAYQSSKPIFLKLAPELDRDTREIFFSRARDLGIDGFILTNTLRGVHEGRIGGWSGLSLTDISRAALEGARALTSVPIVSVGGIMSVEEALRRLDMGADLLQIYTAWIFEGPKFPNLVREAWIRERRMHP